MIYNIYFLFPLSSIQVSDSNVLTPPNYDLIGKRSKKNFETKVVPYQSFRVLMQIAKVHTVEYPTAP